MLVKALFYKAMLYKESTLPENKCSGAITRFPDMFDLSMNKSSPEKQNQWDIYTYVYIKYTYIIIIIYLYFVLFI